MTCFYFEQKINKRLVAGIRKDRAAIRGRRTARRFFFYGGAGMKSPADIYTFKLQYEIGKLNLLEQLFSMCECPEDVFNHTDKDVARNQMMGLAKIIEQATGTMTEFVKACGIDTSAK
jgi:hypothetical protein